MAKKPVDQVLADLDYICAKVPTQEDVVTLVFNRALMETNKRSFRSFRLHNTHTKGIRFRLNCNSGTESIHNIVAAAQTLGEKVLMPMFSSSHYMLKNPANAQAICQLARALYLSGKAKTEC